MREVNHRAKNMLSVVDAIAHQTAARNPENFIDQFSERIQALSANQDLLVRNDWHGVEVEDLVRAQLAPFADLTGSRIVVRGSKLRLNAASAQEAIGLALHELTTNAGKYGALSMDGGRVYVYWEIDGDTFTMRWTERDGPPVSAPKRRGFGTVVMKVMAERSVGGGVELDYPPSGFAWRLTCPAANALEPWGNPIESPEMRTDWQFCAGGYAVSTPKPADARPERGARYRGMTNVLGGVTSAVSSAAQTAAQSAGPSISHTTYPFSSIEQVLRSAIPGNDPTALRDAAIAAVRAAPPRAWSS